MKKKRTKTIEMEHKIKLEVPLVPNFIKIADNGGSISICDIPIQSLEMLADLWKKKLIKRAKAK